MRLFSIKLFILGKQSVKRLHAAVLRNSVAAFPFVHMHYKLQFFSFARTPKDSFPILPLNASPGIPCLR